MKMRNESNFDAYLKCMKFLQFNVTHQKMRTGENFPDFQKGDNSPKIQWILMKIKQKKFLNESKERH